MFFRVAPTCASATNRAPRGCHIGKRLFIGCRWIEWTARPATTCLFFRSRTTCVASLSPSRSQCMFKSLKKIPLWLWRANGHSSFARETELTVWFGLLRWVEICGVISFTCSSWTAGGSGRFLLPKVRGHRKFGRLWAWLGLRLAYGICYLKTGYIRSWSEHTDTIRKIHAGQK